MKCRSSWLTGPPRGPTGPTSPWSPRSPCKQMRSQITSSQRWREGKHISGICFCLVILLWTHLFPWRPHHTYNTWITCDTLETETAQFSFTAQTRISWIVAPFLIIPLTHRGLSGQKRRANPARRKMVSNINVWAREEKSHSVSDESGMVRGQRSHLQEVLVGQHHLEPHFYLEDPEKQQKGSEKGRKSDPDWRLSA